MTDSSSANVTTPAASNNTVGNTVKITRLVFDTVNNVMRVSWHVNTTGTDTLEIGISYSTAGYPSLDTSAHQVVAVKSGTDSAVVKLLEPLMFRSSVTDTTRYYVALWERAENGKFSAPTDSSRDTVASPMYNWQNVTFFTKTPGDTNTVFNGNIRIITDSVQSGDVSFATGTIRYYGSLTPATLSGFILVSVPFYFSQKDQSGKFLVELKLTGLAGLPAKYTAASARIYQLVNGLWYVDRSSGVESGYAWTRTSDVNYTSPMVALIDTQQVSLSRGFHADTVAPGGAVNDTLFISDNCANVSWKYYYAKGGDGYTAGGIDSGTLAAMSATVPVVVPGPDVSSASGLRAMVIVSDGTNADTVNVSRQSTRDSSDFVWTTAGSWVPLRVTAGLGASDMKTILTASVGQAWTYDKKQLRLFRWLPWTGNQSSASKWVEYSDSSAGSFAMTPGMLVWAKSRASMPVNFGAGITPSLRQAYGLSQPLAAGNWNDFAVPYRFDVRMGDILDSTGAGADSLEFYSWVRDTVSGRFVSTPIYIEAFANAGIADRGTVVGSLDLTGYTVYNPLSAPVTLRVAPIPKTMSAYGGFSKKKSGEGWAVAVRSNLADGSRLSPVYCGYAPSKQAGTSYYPAPPTFAQEYVGVCDKAGGQVYGHALQHAPGDGGHSFVLAFVNSGGSPAVITYRVDNAGTLPPGVVARCFDETTGAGEECVTGAAQVTVPGGGTVYRVLAMGSMGYLAKVSLTLKAGVLRMLGVSPNPFVSRVRIRYSLPASGLASVTFAVYDLRGRTVWRTAVDAAGMAGEHQLVWDGGLGRRAGGCPGRVRGSHDRAGRQQQAGRRVRKTNHLSARGGTIKKMQEGKFS